MRFSARLLLLTCLMVYASSAHAIMVKYGTKGGPIEPPAPEPTPAPQPYRVPAPVWEERSNDTPDPNAQWRPPFFVPQPRYTKVITNQQPSISTQPPPQPINNAQRFVNAYIPNKPATGSPAILGSQNLPGIGLRYFFPAYVNANEKPARQEDARYNHIDGDLGNGPEASSDFLWKYEKDATRRAIRNSAESSAGLQRFAVYQFPVYIQPRHH